MKPEANIRETGVNYPVYVKTKLDRLDVRYNDGDCSLQIRLEEDGTFYLHQDEFGKFLTVDKVSLEELVAIIKSGIERVQAKRAPDPPGWRGQYVYL